MKFKAANITVLAVSLLLSLTSSIHILPDSNGTLSLQNSYDYIVVGAGIGGLVVANRLSEDPSVSILVVEAGELDDRAEDVSIPGNIGLEDPRRYKVKLDLASQEFLDGKSRVISQGKVVGGSTIVNGLVWTRGSAADFDAWEDLGNPGWGWADLLPYFKKSEKYTLPPNNKSTHNFLTALNPVIRKHGEKGPIEVGYPNYYYNQSHNFLDGIQELGIPVNEDPNGGSATGASIIASSMVAGNQSRSDARIAYLDPVLDRPNLHLVTGHTVTRVLHDNGGATFLNSTYIPGATGLNIIGVEFAANSIANKIRVKCVNEVLLAAGAIFSPVLLHISGIGPAKVLGNLGVDVAVDLPGVGSNLQDHPTLQPVYKYTAPDVFSAWDIVGSTRDVVREEYLTNRTGPWTAPMVDVVALPALSWVVDDLQEWLRETTNVTNNLPSSYEETLRAGYLAQRDEMISLLARTDTPVYEVMSTSWGQLAVSAMRSLSRGTVLARSSSIFENQPIIDTRFCSHPIDCKLLLLGLEFNDRLIQTSPMARLIPVPPPGFGVVDARNQTALDEVMRPMITSGYHLSGTTSMLPLSLGGVVDPSLRVYGTRNLRVVDAGVIPLLPAAHIQAALYAIAEKVCPSVPLRDEFVIR
ncbi:GMC oxidoreductase [Annulohypoxylon truncatum]|uniref:GMC oxidoreductase n=1 Tax=Annulohypoxylon truncatum TaxID=327061 RepID=UPI002007F14C|nr:GMC oxidoreductase [Annulohypoxylon truncatum]KAI1209556.1 GMC oxidoreductase [Annulohypoxylon truncatum]